MLKAKLTFYTMLASLVAAGVPLDRALARGIPPRLRRPCQRLRERLREGLTLSQAMAEQRRIFSSLELSLVMVGEETGTLDRSAGFLRDHFDRTRQLRAQLLTSMAYPIFTYVAAIPLLTVAELATSQVGTGGLSFDGWGGAIARRCLLGWGLPLLVIALFRFLTPGLLRSPIVGAIINAVPFLGGIQHTYNSSVFWNAFGTCISAGLPYQKAIALAARACPAKLFQNKFLRLAKHMENEGLTFADALERIASARDRRHQFIPLAATGEETGRLDEAAFRLGTITEEATKTSLRRFTAVFPLLVYLVLAGYLAFKIIGFYAGYIHKVIAI